MRTKKIKNPAKIFRSVGNSRRYSCRRTRVSMRGPSVMPLVLNVGNSVGIRADRHVSGIRGPSVMPSVLNVGNSVGIRADGHVSGMRAITRRYSRRKSRRQSVGECGKIPYFFTTLCEIPTGYIPSVLESETSSEIRRWMWQNPVIFLQLSVKYRWVIFRRYIRRWKGKFFLFFLCNPLKKSWIAILQHTQHNNKGW